MTDRDIMQQALEVMGTVGADHICEASHHAKKDRHKLGEPCPLQQRWHIAYQALRERLAQQEQVQEPVAFCYLRQTSSDRNPPHGWAVFFSKKDGDVPLYTAPQQRQWVGLSKEDRYLAIRPLYRDDGSAALAAAHSNDEYEAIEASLWEKNT